MSDHQHHSVNLVGAFGDPSRATDATVRTADVDVTSEGAITVHITTRYTVKAYRGEQIALLPAALRAYLTARTGVDLSTAPLASAA